MDDKSFNIRVPKRWVRVAMIVGVTALIVAPLTAIASHSFTDVPDSNTFHSDIEWMKDSGVTKGCNPPTNSEYCPDDNVTRGQMAAFMNRFAGYIGATDGTPAHADHATNADNAINADDATDSDMLDGKDSTAYRTVSVGANCDQSGGNVCDTSGTLATLNIDAPAAGVVTLKYQISLVETDTGEGLIQAWANADDACNWFLVPLDSLLGSFSTTGFPDLGGTQFHSISGTTNVSVPAGTSTFSVCSAIVDGEAQYASIDAIWTPEGTAIATASADDVMSFPERFGSEFEGESVPGFDN